MTETQKREAQSIRKAELKLAEEIAATLERNNNFWKLSKEEQRREIARDVLRQMKSQRFRPTQGTYLDLKETDAIRAEDGPVQLQDELKDVTSCEVCALGGLFFSATMCGNRITAKELFGDLKFVDSFIRIDLTTHLRKFFSVEQLNMIETAFEDDHGDFLLSYERVQDALNFIDQKKYDPYWTSNSDRLRLIMENIVVHGEFKPTIQAQMNRNRWVTPGFTTKMLVSAL